MNIYLAIGMSGLCINFIYYKWRCQAEKERIRKIKADNADTIGFSRLKHNLRDYDAHTYNTLYGSNLTSREIRQIYSDNIDISEKAFEYFAEKEQQVANKKICSSHPFCFVIIICKFLRKENIFASNRDKKREQDDLAKVAASLSKRATITNEL